MQDLDEHSLTLILAWIAQPHRLNLSVVCKFWKQCTLSSWKHCTLKCGLRERHKLEAFRAYFQRIPGRLEGLDVAFYGKLALVISLFNCRIMLRRRHCKSLSKATHKVNDSASGNETD